MYWFAAENHDAEGNVIYTEYLVSPEEKNIIENRIDRTTVKRYASYCGLLLDKNGQLLSEKFAIYEPRDRNGKTFRKLTEEEESMVTIWRMKKDFPKDEIDSMESWYTIQRMKKEVEKRAQNHMGYFPWKQFSATITINGVDEWKKKPNKLSKILDEKLSSTSNSFLKI